MSYTAALIAQLVRQMPDERVARLHPHDFHRHPAKTVTPRAIVQEIIDAERARRA